MFRTFKEVSMYQHPAMLEILEEERRREKYPDPREWWMYQRELERIQRGPGLAERSLAWAGRRLAGIARVFSRGKSSSRRSRQPSLREECETC
jgi:hypothetical protein